MKKISRELLSKVVKKNREDKNITQSKLSELSGINRVMLSRIATISFEIEFIIDSNNS